MDVVNEFDQLSDDGEDSASEEGSSESDEEDESDDDSSGDEEINGVNEGGGDIQMSVNSSDDDPERERCPVCLNRFIGQDLGTPENCEHTFCYECIEEWSKNINTCPIDRTDFNYIYLRAVPGGNILKKVKVDVLPKEPEEALEETQTLCEVCRSGDREDRLLLCDGCDLAYHCECLDPPLFYIPIEEWFCPPCSGVLQTEGVAGPSHAGMRRIIPRTRASETVRSRVQNLRTGGSSAPRSTSTQRKTITPKPRKKRRRRSYARTYKKVVTLARTKKDLTNAQKSKSATRGSTIILTCRRKRYKSRRKKMSRRSKASTKVLPIPSSKQRIARQLGMSKPLQGSTVPVVKPPSRGRGATRIARLPTHSLFGNKDQLMDFSENFAEDPRNVPSTSTSSRRCSDESFSSASSINILDSIMAGQKILHTKSNDIVIKNDGSLVIKEVNSVAKKSASNQKVEECSSRTPMSIALVKEGVKILTPSSNKSNKTSWKKHADASKTKNVPEKKSTNSNSEKNTPITKPSVTQHLSNNKSTKIKLQTTSSSNVMKNEDREDYKIKSSSMNIIQKEQKSRNTSKLNDLYSLNSKFLSITSDCDTDLSNDTVRHNLKSIKQEKQSVKSVSESENSSYSTNEFSTDDLDNCSSYSIRNNKSTNISKGRYLKTFVKKEILSDDETNSNGMTVSTDAVQIKQEVLSDDETDIECWVSNGDNQSNKTASSIIPNIKKEPTDSERKTFKNYDHLVGNVRNGIAEISCQLENKRSRCISSESITSSISGNSSYSSHSNKCKSKTPIQKIKEEVPSDSEEYSQSLVSNIDSQYLASCSRNSQLCAKDSYESDLPPTQVASIDNTTDSNEPTQAAITNPRDDDLHSTEEDTDSEDEDLPHAQAAPVPTSSDSEDEDISSTQAVPTPTSTQAAPATNCMTDSEEDDLPCTQAAPRATVIDSDDDIPCNQAALAPIVTDSEDEEAPATNCMTDSEEDDLPCTQAALAHIVTDSEDDLPCTQAAPRATVIDSDDDDDIPCNQAALAPIVTDSEDEPPPPTNCMTDSEEDDLPCTQAALAPVVTDSEEDDIPCTQAALAPVVTDSEEDDLPHTQAAPAPTARGFEDDLPCTQAVFLPTKNSNNTKITNPQCPSTEYALSKDNNCKKINTSPPTQISHLGTKSNNGSLCTFSNDQLSDELPPTQMNFQFPKPAIPNQCDKYNRSKSTQSVETSTLLKENKLESSDQRSEFSKGTVATSDTDVSSGANDASILPSTQASSNQITDLPETQAVNFEHLSNLPSTASKNPSFDQRATQILNTSSKEQILSDTQSCGGSELLPATQISNPGLREQSGILSDKPNNDSNINMEDIISNIKQLVNSLSAKEPESMQDKEAYINKKSADNISEQSTATIESTNSRDISEDSKDASSDSNNSRDKILDNLNSESEELSHEKLVEIAKKSKNVTPKKVGGIHKHLPQVISIVPVVKEHIKIKPANKRTFSFEEVAKLEAPIVQEKTQFASLMKNTENKLYENSASDLNDSLPPTQAVNFETIKDKLKESKPFHSKLEVPNSELNCNIFKNPQTANLNKKFGINVSKLDKNTLNVSSVMEDEDFPATQLASCVKENKKSSNSSISEPVICSVNNKQFSEFLELDDLPATQACNVPDILNRAPKYASHISKPIISKSHKNSSSKKKMIGNEDLSSIISNNLCKINQNEKSSTSKGDTFNQNKELHLHDVSISQNKNFHNANLKASKQSLDEKLDMIKNESKNAFKKLKQETEVCDKQKLDMHSLKLKIKKEICDDTENVNSNEMNYSSNINLRTEGLSETHPITVKKEKIDFEFVKPSTDLLLLNSRKSDSFNPNLVRVKSEEPSDDLPATQAVNVDPYDDLPATQVTSFHPPHAKSAFIGDCAKETGIKIIQKSNSFPLPEVKKEIVSDDEDDVSIIECVMTNSKTQEVISIDDDGDEGNAIHDAKAKGDILSIGNEKYAENESLPFRSASKSKTSNNSLKESKVKDKQHPSVKVNKQKYNNDAEKSKNEQTDDDSVRLKKHKTDDSTRTKKHKTDDDSTRLKKHKTDDDSTRLKKHKTDDDSTRLKKYKTDDDSIKSKKHKTDGYSTKLKKHKTDDDPTRSKKDNTDGDSARSKKHKADDESTSSKKRKTDDESLRSKKHKTIDDSARSKRHNSDDGSLRSEKQKYDDDSVKSKLESKSHQQTVQKTSKNSGEQKNKNDETKSKSENRKNNPKHLEKCREFNDPSTVGRKEKNDNSKSKLVCPDLKTGNNSKDYSVEKNKNKCDDLSENLKDPFNKERRYSSEKENNRSLDKNKHKNNFITLKPMARKRSESSVEENEGVKRMKYDHPLDTESCSSEDIFDLLPNLQNGSLKMSSNTKVKSECDIISDGISTPRSDKGLENVNVLNTESVKELHSTDVKKVLKEDLKEEIANEVKIILKPFFKTGLISKDDYKDIMRRAVPKIFMNCHNCINPEKIRKLVLGYVSLLSKS